MHPLRKLRQCLKDDIVRDIVTSATAQAEIEEEWQQLMSDRESLRSIFPTGNTKVVLPVNLSRLIWNAQKIFHIDARATTDLHPIKVIEGEH